MRMLAVLSLLLGGCGSCGRTQEEGVPGEDVTAPTAAAPLQARSRIPTVPAQSGTAAGTAALPTRAVQSGVPPSPAATTALEVPGTVSEPEEDDGDCIVVADADPDYGPPPLRVNFSAEAECNAGQPSFRWNFGDGSPVAAEANPSHIYAAAGDYTASVTITSPGGATASDEIDITVEEGEGEPLE